MVRTPKEPEERAPAPEPAPSPEPEPEGRRSGERETHVSPHPVREKRVERHPDHLLPAPPISLSLAGYGCLISLAKNPSLIISFAAKSPQITSHLTSPRRFIFRQKTCNLWIIVVNRPFPCCHVLITKNMGGNMTSSHLISLDMGVRSKLHQNFNTISFITSRSTN